MAGSGQFHISGMAVAGLVALSQLLRGVCTQFPHL